MTLGVGFLGAGPATQAIHLPTLARLADLFRVVNVMDVDADVASAVAARAGAARTSSSVEELLADPDVDVVTVCSPPRFHADQVEAACRGRVRAVLCEKPFAMSADEAERMRVVAEETGVPIVVGAMHTFDPAWLWACRARGSMGDVHSVRSRIVLPPNRLFEDASTELVNQARRAADPPRDPPSRANYLEAIILGLVIHDLPLVRHFAPDIDEVLYADVVESTGYAVVVRSGSATVEYTGSLTEGGRPDWTLEAVSSDALLRVEFTPSYVHAGSGKAELTTSDGTHEMPFRSTNGYEGEWRHLADLAGTGQTNAAELQAAIDDLRYALTLAAASAAHVEQVSP